MSMNGESSQWNVSGASGCAGAKGGTSFRWRGSAGTLRALGRCGRWGVAVPGAGARLAIEALRVCRAGHGCARERCEFLGWGTPAFPDYLGAMTFNWGFVQLPSHAEGSSRPCLSAVVPQLKMTQRLPAETCPGPDNRHTSVSGSSCELMKSPAPTTILVREEARARTSRKERHGQAQQR